MLSTSVCVGSHDLRDAARDSDGIRIVFAVNPHDVNHSVMHAEPDERDDQTADIMVRGEPKAQDT